MKRLNQLDGLRGIFALMIVIYHMPLFFDYKFKYNFFLSNLYIFVDYFFCLSGFIISYKYSNSLLKKDDFFDFIQKRIIRIYPLHFFILCLYFFSYIILGLPDKDGWLRLLDSILLTNSTTILGSLAGTNFVSWSISAEMISYIIFGLIFLSRNKRIFIILIPIIGIVFFHIFKIPFFSTSSFGFVRCLIGFGFGSILFEIYNNNKVILSKNYENLIPALIFLLFFVISFLTGRSGSIIKNGTLINSILTPFIMCLTIFILVASKGGWVSKILNLRIFKYLGMVSYSVYMIHPFIFHFLKKTFIFLGFKKTLLSIYFSPMIILLILSVSHLTYYFLELKTGHYLKNTLLKK